MYIDLPLRRVWFLFIRYDNEEENEFVTSTLFFASSISLPFNPFNFLA